jgi:putative Mn2+ efflux pump MntP
MPILEVLALAVGLGADAMSVCAAVGVRWHGPRQKFRLAWHMGLYQFLMPVLGWLAGQRAAVLLKDFGRYAAAGLVMAVGAKMLYEALRSRPGSMAEGVEHAAEGALHVRRSDPTRGWSLVALSIATSIDALVVGFSLGLRGRGIWQASIVIGLVAGLMALIGVNLGQRAGAAFGRHAETAGAAVLIGLGVAFLWL